jgi:hypothetical protein
LSQTSFDFVEPVESAYPSDPSPSPAELMAKRVIEKSRRKNPGRLPPGLRKKPRGPIPGMRYVLSKTVVDEIRSVILAWPHPTITWEALRANVNSVFTSNWTRQALSNHAKLLSAYQKTKKRLREEQEEREQKEKEQKEQDSSSNKKRSSLTRNTSVPVLQDRIRFLEDRVIELEGVISAYEAQYARWRQNAHLAGVSMSVLDRQQPGGDRGRSDK